MQWFTPETPALGRLREENCEFKALQCNIMKIYIFFKKRKGKEKGERKKKVRKPKIEKIRSP